MILFLGILAALAVAPQSTLAAERLEVTADRDYGRNYASGDDRLGVFVSNRPGGLYMGRLFTAETFSAAGAAYTSRKGLAYVRAHARGDVNHCLWVGPSGRFDDVTPWFAPVGTSTLGCDPALLDWLGSDRETFNDGSAIYSHVNCPPPSNVGSNSLGTFGGLTHTTKPTPVYYNLEWKWDGAQFDAIAPRVKVGEAPIGTAVFYRYTTKGGAFASVFFDGNSGSYGWTFVNADAVPKINYWSPPSDPPNYRVFHCDSRVAPATDVIEPWTVWLAMGGANFGPQA